MIEPDNKMTVKRYREIEPHMAFNESCISNHVNEVETQRLEKLIEIIKSKQDPKKAQDKRKNIFVGMDGCCRHKNPLT